MIRLTRHFERSEKQKQEFPLPLREGIRGRGGYSRGAWEGRTPPPGLGPLRGPSPQGEGGLPFLTSVLVLLALVGVLALGGCGKKGPPSPPGPPAQITWPRAYPTH
jgi:hypothetical protein